MKILRKSFPLKGLTLVELLIYVTLLSGVLMVTMSVLWRLVAVNNKNSNYVSVTNNLRLPLMKITQEIRNAKSIQSITANTLTLESFDPTRNPTVITWNGTQILMGKGMSGLCSSLSPCVINDNQTTITGWTMTNRSGVKSSSVQIEIIAKNNQNKTAWDRTESYVISSTLRSK